MQQYNEFNKVIKQSGYFIYDSKNIKTFDPHRLLLNLSDKQTQKGVINILLHQILAYATHRKKVIQKQ